MAMATEQRKTRGELRAMFWHDFLGSMPLKNAWYLTMLALAPLVLLTAIFTEPIMTWLGAPRELLPLYCNYFRVGLASIYLACPAGVLIPAYLRATFQNKKAMLLDHAVTWSMVAGCWFTVHVLHEGAVVTPLATVVFLNWLGWGLLAVYTVGLVVAGLQTWVFEAYLRRRQIPL